MGVFVGNLLSFLSHPENHYLDVACLELGTQLTVVSVAQACLCQSRFSRQVQPSPEVFQQQQLIFLHNYLVYL